MLGGIMGKVLRVDLSNRKISTEEYGKDLLEKYVGQDCLATRIIYDEVPPGVGALDPQSRLIFSCGPLTGTTVQSSCDHSISAKSPQSGFTIYHSHTHSDFGRQLKFSGYDIVIVQGKAEKPVYLWINDKSVEIKDATHLWGKIVDETQDLIMAE
jgi:aldehyde:ferredoxin oxidoreductase